MAPANRRATRLNPIAFRPGPVTVFTTIIYVGLFVALLVVHLRVPPAPSNPTPVKGINLTEAWRDLQELSNGFHPYNSRRNDEVRDWLLLRIADILKENKAQYATESLHSPQRGLHSWNTTAPAPVTVFNDVASNVTFSATPASRKLSVYFEGTNVMVYIRGSEDEDDAWWRENRNVKTSKTYKGKGGVMINAHYDSVSTGYGATDDGVGVISVLQMIKYFSHPDRQPKRGVLALLNNGEEDYLNGATAFVKHPISAFPHTFLNLEGAGAGGRAILFRSTDTEVTRAYKKSPYPYGTVIAGDAFKRGVIRSQTDYIIFNGILGYRGLDVAFFAPRARYHTDQDSARHTSMASLWHMLSATVETMKELTADTSSTFEGPANEDGKLTTGNGSVGVWFDVFGKGFAVFRLHTLFALSVTLLVVAPVVFIALSIILIRLDKFYLLSRKRYLHSSDDDEPIYLGGWKGLFRFPIAFVIATAIEVALAYLVTKVNPNIVYSSEYVVWMMMLTAWFSVAWFFLRGADFMRPSALQRMYALQWLFVGGWALLVVVTVTEDRYDLASGYFIVIYVAAIAAALLLSYLELFALPKKAVYVEHVNDAKTAGSQTPTTRRSESLSSGRVLAGGSRDGPPASRDGPREDDDEATETTSLLRGDRQRAFGRLKRSRSERSALPTEQEEDESDRHDPLLDTAYGEEQPWSSSLPQWIWLLQFLLMAPIVIILVGQIGLVLGSALGQTLSDGNSPFTPYIAMAILSVLIVAPVGPFIHRVSYVVPSILFVIFAVTLIYNLLAFPFSSSNRLKVYFIQRVDLDTGFNNASLTGLESYVRDIIQDIPSASGQKIHCGELPNAGREGLTSCWWQGLAPKVVKTLPSGIPPEKEYALWMKLDTKPYYGTKYNATIKVAGRNTRGCRLLFDAAIDDFYVEGQDPSDVSGRALSRPQVGEKGTNQIRLWSRQWEKEWTVHVAWKGAHGMNGRAVCFWSDDNASGTIPALDELKLFMPTWSTVTKLDDGLVEGSKAFAI